MARYPFPWDLLVRLALALPSGRTSILEDATAMVGRVQRPPGVLSVEHIPLDGPAVLAVNHYQRRGLWIGWPAAVITLAVAARRGEPPLHWLVTGGLRWCQGSDRGPEVPLSGAVFRAVARSYGMAALPLESGAGRAAALRTWLGWLERGEVCGIFPEGLVGRSDELRAPVPGFEALCRVLRRRGVPIVPCGVFERDDTLNVRFGEPLACHSVCADLVMQAIAELLPDDLRGVYAVGPVG